MKILPVILCGGSGKRLWPFSNLAKPKQFLNVGPDQQSLFQQTVLRCKGKRFSDRPIIVAANRHRFLVGEALAEIGVSADILLEPVPKNSCAAITAASVFAQKRDPNAILLIVAADHMIKDVAEFQNSAVSAFSDAQNGNLVTFGIRPTSPDTNYGYIRADSDPEGCKRVKEFVEKPDLEAARKFLTEGLLWNSGNFLFSAKAFLAELGKFHPEILDGVTNAVGLAENDLDFLRLDKTSFERIPSISVDYAVMENTAAARVLPVDYEWTDVGNWASFSQMYQADADGNIAHGNIAIHNGSNNIVHSDKNKIAIVDLDQIVVASRNDTVLVANANTAENVKLLLERLERDEKSDWLEGSEGYRPWGSYEKLVSTDTYQVKRLNIKPDGVLSLQTHRFRSEHWVVVAGTAEVVLDEQTHRLDPNMSIYIPVGSTHRITNIGEETLVIIEVQTGTYFGEDDIVRLEDIYSRKE